MRLYFVVSAQGGSGRKYDRLNKIGIEQAKRLGPFFKNKRIDIVYCSTNMRAKQTYKHIKPFLNDVPLIFTKKLRQHGVPAEVGTGYKFLEAGEKETEPELEKRTRNFFEFLKRHYKKEHVLVLSHKEVLKSLILKVMSLPSPEKKYFRLHSAGVSVFEIEKGMKGRAFRINDISHLFRKY